MRLKWLLCGALLVACTSAHAQIQTKATIQNGINTTLADNNAGAITPAIVRGLFTEILNSYLQGATVNAQVGTSYTAQCADMGALLTFNNAASVSVQVPGASQTCFNSNWAALFKNNGSGTVTLTPTTGLINGQASAALGTGQGLYVFSDGTNYQTWGGFGSGTVSGPGSSTTGHLAIWNNSGGTVLADLAFLDVARGGTGLTSGTSGGIPYFASGSTMASSAALTLGAFVLGGGAGAAPTALGPCTSGQVLVGQASGAALCQTLTGPVSLTAGGVTSVPAASTSTSGLSKCDGTTITCAGGTFTAVGAATTSIDANGGTSVASGTTGNCAYENGSAKFALKPCDKTAADYNAAGSVLATSGTISASSTTLTLGSAIDFQNANSAGFAQGIRVAGAGALPSIGAATSFTAVPGGTLGSTTYVYYVEALDASGGVKAPAASTFSNGASALSSGSFVTLSWTAGTGSPSAYAIYVKCTGCTYYTSTPQLIAVTSATSFTDTGTAIIAGPEWLSPTILVSDQAQWLRTTISSGAGTLTLTLAAAATTAVAAPGFNNVLHDDTAALQNLINAAQTDHSRARLLGTNGRLFRTSALLQISSHIELFGDGVQGTSNLALGGFRNLILSDLSNSTAILPAFTVSGIEKNSNDAVELHHFAIAYPQPAMPNTAVFGYYFHGANSIGCMKDRVHDMLVTQADIGIRVANCNGWKVDNNSVYNDSNSFIRVDKGTGSNDWWIEDNTLTNGPNSQSNSSFILMTSSGAPHIFGNKINAGQGGLTGVWGILINPQFNGSSVEPPVIAKNSIEGNLTGIAFFNSCSAAANGSISTVGTITGGTSGTPGTYINQLFTGGTGTEAYGTVIIGPSGAVTAVNLFYGGFGYVVNDTLSATVGGVSGFSFKVTAIAQNCSVSQTTVSGNQVWAATDVFTADSLAQKFVNGITFTGNSFLTVGAASGIFNANIGVSSLTNALFVGNTFGNSSGLGSTAFFDGGGNTNIRDYSNAAVTGANQLLGSGTTAPGSFSSCNSGSTITNTFWNTVEAHLFGGTNVGAVNHNGVGVWGGSNISLQPTTVVLQPGDTVTVTTNTGTCPTIGFIALTP